MVLEQFLDQKIVRNHFFFVLILSAAFVYVAYLVQSFFFPNSSVAIVLLLTILIVPSLHHIMTMEEKMERKVKKHFWRRHKTLFKVYSGAFLGILIGFLFIGFTIPGTLEYQNTLLEKSHLRPELISTFMDQPYEPSITTAISLFSNNMRYILIGFVLSVFYGAGAAFIIAFNASFFAAFVVALFTRWASAVQLTEISLLHLLPEAAGYIFAAIAGAAISKTIIHEKIKGRAFSKVLGNSLLLLFFSIILIFAAAIIETFVTAPVFHSLL